MCKYELHTSWLSKGYRLSDGLTDRPTDRHERNYTARRFAGGQQPVEASSVTVRLQFVGHLSYCGMHVSLPDRT